MKDRPIRFCVLLVGVPALALFWLSLIPEAAHAGKSPPLPYTSSLDNGLIKVGIDANAGGVLSYLSPSGSSTNLINTHDHGREVQQSYYAGYEIDRRAAGQSPTWSPWSWNPIGAGDAFGNPAIILDLGITSTTLYGETQPLLWDMNNERCECVFQTWVTLERRRVRVHNRLTTRRTDARWPVVARTQELPAVYPIADLPRVVSYTGTQPFTGGATSDIPKSTGYWVSQWTARENWGACVNQSNFGVGVYTPGRTTFLGGLYGSPSGTTTSINTCYLSPIEVVPLDKTSTFDYDYWLALGTIDQIRQEFYAVHQSVPPPPARFPAGDRQVWNFNAEGDFGGWTPTANIASTSVTSGRLGGRATSPDPYMHSAPIGKPAADNKVVLRMRNGTASSSAQLFFTTEADGTWTGSKSKRISIVRNSPYTVYTFDMAGVPTWRGTITRLRLDPAEAAGTFGIDWLRIGN